MAQESKNLEGEVELRVREWRETVRGRPSQPPAGRDSQWDVCRSKLVTLQAPETRQFLRLERVTGNVFQAGWYVLVGPPNGGLQELRKSKTRDV